MTFPSLVRWMLVSCALIALASTTRFVASPSASRSSSSSQAAPSSKDVATEDEARARCSAACHKYPSPDILPRAAWRDELVRMMLIQEGVPEPAGAQSFIPLPPDWLRVLRFYEAHAPEKLPDPEPWPAAGASSLKMTPRPLAPKGREGAPAVANLRLVDLDGDRRLDIVASEMRAGSILAGLATNNHELREIAKLRHPAHIEQADLDKDGLPDLVVADLGSFQPADHQNGSVYWLQARKDGTFRAVEIAKGLSRLADARVADFDGDGDLDIILAVFGWRRTGNVTLLENLTRSWDKPVFQPHVIAQRTGAIHVPVADMNGDNRPDFLVIFAQESESVMAFINTGKGLTFTEHVLYAAPHPNWGSSGIEPADLDRDGDLDIILSHGDTFDDFVLKPYHGIQWLENTGGLAFKAHDLATLPGAHGAKAADLDGDGDEDIVSTAMVAGGGGDLEPKLASLVWLKQVKPGVFERHTLEMGSPYHATLDTGDLDGDGDLEIAVGWFSFAKPMPAWIDVWVGGPK
jgi:hypothetical protein